MVTCSIRCLGAASHARPVVSHSGYSVADKEYRLCGHPQLRNLAERVDTDSADGMALAAVIASIVAAAIGTALNALLVGVLVLRLWGPWSSIKPCRRSMR